MKNWGWVTVVGLASLLVAPVLMGCDSGTPTLGSQPDDSSPGDVTIETDRDTYTPIMSSTVGIGLTPVSTLARPPQTVQYHWRTDFGHFATWDPPEFRVNLLGTEVITNGEKIYWSYNPDEMGAEKPSVHISLHIEDAQSGQVLTGTNLEIGWDDQDTARVTGHAASQGEGSRADLHR